MGILLNRKTFEPALPYMPMAAVMPMIATDMTGHPPLHEWDQRRISGRLYDKMEMIGHEADAKELNGILGFGRGEQIKECGVIAILVENCGTTVPTIQNLVGLPSDLSTWNTRHETRKLCES